MYWFAFYRVASVSVGHIPPMLFYFSSVALWTYFSQTCAGVSEALNHHAHLMTKVHFPRLIVPISIVTWRLIPLALQFAVFALFYCALGWMGRAEAVTPSPWIALVLPALVFLVALLALGTGLFIAACTVRFRDLHHLFSLVLQLWMFGTPVVYPLAEVPQPYRNWLALNPLSAIFEAFRWALFGTPVDLRLMTVSVIMVLMVFSLGLYTFQRVERTFVDTI